MALLTIGMAVYNDFHGVWFSTQALRMYHDLSDVELLVVDNRPQSVHGEEVQKFIDHWAHHRTAGVRYIAMPSPTGTTQPRQRIFDESRTPWTMCIDSHVLLWKDSLAKWLDYMRANPQSKDILTGPIVLDDLQTMHTNFKREWRGQMWGTWETDPRGVDENAPPFEVWGNGLGLFAMRTTAFPGFDRRWRGFGGEEGCIHEVVRQQGGKALCMPFGRWVHRFAKPGVSNFAAPTKDKVLNYILGYQRIGFDVEEVRQHFVDVEHACSAEQWASWLANPEQRDTPNDQTAQDRAPMAAVALEDGEYVAQPSRFPQPQVTRRTTLNGVFEWCKAQPRDLNEHLAALALYAQKAEGVVVELSKRRESTVGLLAGRPRVLHTFTSEPDALHEALHFVVGNTNPLPIQQFNTSTMHSPLAVEQIPECDLLYIDSQHDARILLAELQKHGPRVKRFIVIRGTSAFGDIAEGGGGPGLYFGLMKWFEEDLQQRGKEWRRVYRADNQYGLSVYSCDPAEVCVDVGPGTELQSILRSLGIAATHGCDCKAKAATMDQWGIERCEQERDTIIDWLREGAPRWGWADFLRAAGNAVMTGLAFSLNPVDPYPGLVDEAIRRAKLTRERNRQNAVQA